MYLFMTLALTLSMSIPAFSIESGFSISNVNASIPRSSIVSQEIIYVTGVPVLFETYKYNEYIVDIASLLELTPNGYRVVRCGDEINRPMPGTFMDNVLSVHDRKRQTDSFNEPTSRWTNSGHHRNHRDSQPIASIGGGAMIPGTRVEHWFDWQIHTVVIGTDVWVGSGGMRASVLQVAPASSISITENITVNSLATSISFPASFGVGLAPNTRSFSITAHDALMVSATRGSFRNSWHVPTLNSNLVTISTSTSSGVRNGHSVAFGNVATATIHMSSTG